jgi:hypothetical protein
MTSQAQVKLTIQPNLYLNYSGWLDGNEVKIMLAQLKPSLAKTKTIKIKTMVVVPLGVT